MSKDLKRGYRVRREEKDSRLEKVAKKVRKRWVRGWSKRTVGSTFHCTLRMGDGLPLWVGA